ncbi:hypothetical protein V6N13_021916 [Hibiscus sabdariffa]|uniref:Uncharacterized protein n=1 Tax=Hibiscus sabdariffa TaxID=183260 RepID=A0ABR2CSD6_9ROSI
MKSSLFWRGSQAAALLPNKFLTGFTEVTEERLNSCTKIVHLVSHSTCKQRNREKRWARSLSSLNSAFMMGRI